MDIPQVESNSELFPKFNHNGKFSRNSPFLPLPPFFFYFFTFPFSSVNKLTILKLKKKTRGIFPSAESFNLGIIAFEK